MSLGRIVSKSFDGRRIRLVVVVVVVDDDVIVAFSERTNEISVVDVASAHGFDHTDERRGCAAHASKSGKRSVSSVEQSIGDDFVIDVTAGSLEIAHVRGGIAKGLN